MSDLDKASAYLARGMDADVRRLLAEHAAGIRREAPKGSGRLQRSVVARASQIEVGAPYASFVDDDTGFATGGVEELEQRIVDAIERGLS